MILDSVKSVLTNMDTLNILIYFAAIPFVIYIIIMLLLRKSMESAQWTHSMFFKPGSLIIFWVRYMLVAVFIPISYLNPLRT